MGTGNNNNVLEKTKTFFYDCLAPVVRILYRDKISSKYIKGTSLKLYYEKAQHLGFLFQKEISYEAAFNKRIMEYIKEGDLVFEIGSNIGQYSLLISEKIGKTGKLICVEPDANNYHFLVKNIEANNCSNIELLQLAVSDKESKAIFYKDTITGGRMSSLFQKYTGQQFKGITQEIQTTTLNNLTDQFGIPDFVKVDVEGAEELVFSNTTILHEDTIYLVEVREETKEHIFSKFNKEGFITYYLENDMAEIRNSDEIPEFADLLMKKKSG